MGIFSNFFKSKKVSGASYGYQMRSARWSKQAWYHDTVRATVDAIATHGAKGQFQAVKLTPEGRIEKIDRADTMTRLLNEKPNPIMSGVEFKYRMIANLETRSTAIAYIKWNGGKPEAIFPVDYSNYEVLGVQGGGYAIRFTDYEGHTSTLMLQDCIVLRKFYNDRLASGDDNGPIYRVLDMSQASDEGFIESLQTSNKVHGIIKQKKAMLDPEDVKRAQDEFSRRLIEAAKSGGVVSVDSMEDFTPLSLNQMSANASQMALISQRIYTYFRTPEEVVQNRYSENVGLAWHEGKIEPIWEAFAEAVTNAYYTKREKALGFKIIMTGGVMTGLSMQSITQILSVTRETGELTINERRELLGFGPVEGGDVRESSLNYVNADKKDEYQGVEDEDTSK